VKLLREIAQKLATASRSRSLDKTPSSGDTFHPPEGLGYQEAARVAAGLVAGARELGRSGVDLKDTSRGALDPHSVMELH
jgi:hypothetical protein